MTLEEIGDNWDDALLCVTDLTACCRGGALGDWFFPNETQLPNTIPFFNDMPNPWDFYRSRGLSVVRLNRRRGGVNGIYRCEIPVSVAPSVVYQNIYIGVYTTSSGELYMYSHILFKCSHTAVLVLQKSGIQAYTCSRLIL